MKFMSSMTSVFEEKFDAFFVIRVDWESGPIDMAEWRHVTLNFVSNLFISLNGDGHWTIFWLFTTSLLPTLSPLNSPLKVYKNARLTKDINIFKQPTLNFYKNWPYLLQMDTLPELPFCCPITACKKPHPQKSWRYKFADLKKNPNCRN